MHKRIKKQTKVEQEILTLPVNTIEPILVQRGTQGVGAIAQQMSGADVGRADIVCEQRGPLSARIRLQLVVKPQTSALA